MQVSKKHFIAVPLLATLAACASLPDGPTVQAMPGTGKTFDQFQADDYSCRGYASNTAGNPQDAQVNSTLGSAALGTAVGALAGAAIGGGRGAGVGAGAGLLFGTAAGADAGNAAGYSVQRRYDMAYSQCMYAKGEKVPMGRQYQSSYAPPPPPPPNYGPPPGYAPPPPPPGYGAPLQYAPPAPPGAPPGYPN